MVVQTKCTFQDGVYHYILDFKIECLEPRINIILLYRLLFVYGYI